MSSENGEVTPPSNGAEAMDIGDPITTTTEAATTTNLSTREERETSRREGGREGGRERERERERKMYLVPFLASRRSDQ